MTQELKAEQVVETPSAPVVDVASLQAQLKSKEVELEQTKKGLSTAHQTISQRDRELKAQTDLRAEIQSIRDDIIFLAADRVNQEEVEPTDGTSRQNVLTELQKRRDTADNKRRQEADAVTRQSYNQQADAIFAQAGTVFEGEDLKDIEELLNSGNLVLARREVAKAIKSKPLVTKGETPKESEEEIRERIYKEEMEKRHPGMYASDAGLPSGSKKGTLTAEAVKNMSSEERFARSAEIAKMPLGLGMK